MCVFACAWLSALFTSVSLAPRMTPGTEVEMRWTLLLHYCDAFYFKNDLPGLKKDMTKAKDFP